MLERQPAPLAVRRPWLLLLLTTLVTAGAVVGALRIEPEVDFVDAVPEHDGLRAYRATLEKIDGIRFVAVYMAHDGGSGTDHLRGQGFDALVAEQEDLTQTMTDAFPQGTFSHSLSVYEAMRAGNHMLAKIATAGNPPESSYSMPQDPVTYDAVKQQALAGGTLDDVLARDGSSALMLFFFATDDMAEARTLTGDAADVLETWAADAGNHPVTQEHAPSGLLWASHVTDERNLEETRFWAPVAAGGVLAVLLWATRRVSNALIAVASVSLALVWTYGVMGFMGIRISFLTFILAPVVIGIGVDYAVHVLHRYEEERDAGRTRRDALSIAVRRTGAAVALAAATTAAGLAVLLLVPSPLFSEIGGMAALGTLLGFVTAVTVAPALRAVLPEVRGRARRDRLGAGLARAGTTIGRHPVTALVAVAAIVGGAAFAAASHTRIESGSAENEFPQDDPLITLQHRIEAEYGAFQRAYLVVEGDIARPDALHAIHAAAGAAADLRLYRDASAVTDLILADEATDDGAVDILESMLLGMTGSAPADEDRLPQTAQEAREALDSLFEDPLWRSIAPFTVSRGYDLAVVAIELEATTEQADLVALQQALREDAVALRSSLGDDYTVTAAGAPVNRAAVIEQTPDNVRLAVLGAAGAAFIVLVSAWARRGVEGLVAALAAGLLILAAALVLLAAIPGLDAFYNGWAARGGPANSASLNDMFLIGFAITVAVGVDDFVHLASRFWEARDAGHDPRTALEESFRHAGRAVTATSLTTFVAFALMTGVYFLQSKNLAILTAVGILAAYVLTLLVAPVVLAKALRGRRRSSGHGS